MGSGVMKEPVQRSRPLYALAAVLIAGMGLAWRALPLSDFASKYGGDALWALMVFCGMGFLFARASTLQVSLFALGFAWAIEFLQLYHAPWIDAVRGTLPGRLVLGSTFNPPDLLAYVAGVALGALLERAGRRARRKVVRDI